MQKENKKQAQQKATEFLKAEHDLTQSVWYESSVADTIKLLLKNRVETVSIVLREKKSVQHSYRTAETTCAVEKNAERLI